VRLSIILPVAALLAAISTPCLADPYIKTTRPGLDDAHPNYDRTWLTMAEPSAVIIEPGDAAPDFSYQVESGEWLKLHEILEHGSVLLVFVPSDPELRTLESERDSLLRVGIIPVAVFDRRSNSTVALAHRLGLGFPVIADPTGSIASQFNLIGPPTVRARPGWFVLDRSGRVRALNRRGLPPGGYVHLACDALDIASPDATASASSRQR